MSSFSCAHLDAANGRCLLLRLDCVPGRRGCVLGGKSVFAFPVEERLRDLETTKRDTPKAPPSENAGAENFAKH